MLSFVKFKNASLFFFIFHGDEKFCTLNCDNMVREMLIVYSLYNECSKLNKAVILHLFGDHLK